MVTARTRLAALAVAVAAALTLGLTACGSGDQFGTSPTGAATGGGADASQTIVVGSQAYYSNEVIAEIYAQALEVNGFDVERRFQIGQRDAYMPAMEAGEITVFPEYTGNLLQWFEPDTPARTADDVYAALVSAVPANLAVLEQAPATDGDSYTVTQAFASQYGLTSIGDLAKVDVPLVLGGPPELAARPYGPTGLAQTYGVDVQFQATGDTTVDELVAGTINVANVFTADPRIQTDSLQPLEDPNALFLASNVVPLVNADVADAIAPTIDAVSAKLTEDALIAMNVESTVGKKSSAEIATAWLAANGLT